MFEAEVEGHQLTVSAPELAGSEAHAFLDPLCLVVLGISLSVALLAKRGRVLAWGLAVAGVFWAWVLFKRDPWGPIFALVPALDERTSHLALGAAMAMGGAAGGIAALVVAHVYAKERPALPSTLSAVGCAATALLGGVTLWLAHPARELREELASIHSVPYIDVGAPVMHVDQSRQVPVGLTELGYRSHGLLGLGGRVRTPDDARLAELDAQGWRRSAVGDIDRPMWTASLGAEDTVRVTAPSTAGAFEASVELHHGPIRVHRTFGATAIDDRGDPLLPLHAGSRLVYARTRGRGPPMTELPPLIVEVTGESVADGFRTLSLEAHAEGEPPQSYTVVPWEGTWRMQAEPDASQLVERLPSTDGTSPDPATPVDGDGPPPADAATVHPGQDGEPCRVRFIPSTCVCTSQGPVRCASGGTGETLMRLGLGIITFGISEAAAFHGVPVPETRWALVEVDGQAVEPPSGFLQREDARRAPRRRGR